MFLIPRHISSEFGNPILWPRPRKSSFATLFVLVPKASMNEDDSPSRREDYIRLARQTFYVQPIAVAKAVNKFAHQHFWPSVSAADSPHVFRAPFF